MKIKILNKPDIEKLALMPFEDKTALISIATVGVSYAELKNKPEFLLQIKFNDVENDIFFDFEGNLIPEEIRNSVAEKYHIITDEQAKEIADFIKNIEDKAEILICQCEHGQ